MFETESAWTSIGLERNKTKLLWDLEMNNYNTIARCNDRRETMEKYVVLTTEGYFKGSWKKQKDALNHIKQAIKNDRDSGRRYLILEALQEVGTKTPEIEIEEL